VNFSGDSSRPTRHDPYAALRLRDYRYLFGGRFILTLGEQMLNVALGWELYLRTHDAKFLGFVGLALIVPVVLFSLPAGQLVDRTDRRRTLMLAQTFVALCAAGLAVLSFTRGQLPLYYICIFCIGTGLASLCRPARRCWRRWCPTRLLQTPPRGIAAPGSSLR
jgi:MFS family permease